MPQVTFQPRVMVVVKQPMNIYGWMGRMVVEKEVGGLVHVIHPRYGQGAFLPDELEFAYGPW